MKAFTYITARDADEAATLVRRDGRFIAGGVDLLGELKEGLIDPARLVNVKRIPDPHEIVTDISAAACFTGTGFVSQKSAFTSGVRRWWISADRDGSVGKASTICLISAPTTCPATLTTPCAPRLSIGSVRPSSPILKSVTMRAAPAPPLARK